MELLKAVDKLAEILENTKVAEVKIKEGQSYIYMSKNVAISTLSAPVVTQDPVIGSDPVATKTVAEVVEDVMLGEEIKSPMVGTFYSAPSPDSLAFVKVGQKVEKGETLCIIEAMKIMNKIEADKSGTIVSILVNDGEPVQYDQPLFIIE